MEEGIENPHLRSRRQKHKEEEVAEQIWREKELRRRKVEPVNDRRQHREPRTRNPQSAAAYSHDHGAGEKQEITVLKKTP